MFSVFFYRTAHQLVVTLVNNFSLASNEIIANPGTDIIREVLRRQNHAGREVRRLGQGEHNNVLELRAVINGVLWRLRPRGMVILGALAKGRSASRRLALLVMKFNSLVVAASFTLLLVYCRTDLNPADGPSRHGLESSARRRWKCAQEATASNYWTFSCAFDCAPDPHQISSLDCGFLQILFHGRLHQTTHRYRNGSPPL